jgi:phosphoheptose isomerase
MKNGTKEIFDDLFRNFPDLTVCSDIVLKSYSLILDTYKRDGKLLVCGNGGSAADAEHIVGELMKGFLLKRGIPQEHKDALKKNDQTAGEILGKGLQRALPAISLVSQVSLLTAFANDVDSDLIFAQQVYGYGRKNDLLIAISTSGNSRNVINAAIVAGTFGMTVIGLTGKTGGKLARFCDVCICAPSDITFRVQEFHLPLYHTLCAMVEHELFEEGPNF